MTRLTRCTRYFALAAAAFTCCALAGAARAQTPGKQSAACERPAYPRGALSREEDGVVMLGFLVRPDGTVAQSLVLSSSGSAELDRTTQTALSKCQFARKGIDGQGIEYWESVAYSWVLESDPEFKTAKRDAAFAAKGGDAAAAYRLSLLLMKTARTEAGRERALAALRDAAERGHPHAQYQLGLRYERGDGVAADRDEAMRWYEAAAKQEDVFALERLKLGRLVEPIAN